ncbi:MAG: hypothetical protein AAF938_16525 [Myxococcota bacterium]
MIKPVATLISLVLFTACDEGAVVGPDAEPRDASAAQDLAFAEDASGDGALAEAGVSDAPIARDDRIPRDADVADLPADTDRPVDASPSDAREMATDGDASVDGPPRDSIVFQDDFDRDAVAGWSSGLVQGSWGAIRNGRLDGWDGARVVAVDRGKAGIDAIDGIGVGGSRALWFRWSRGDGRETQLFKHLTGDERVGYRELYVRYRLRLPDAFMAGRSGFDGLGFWKFGRLFQNTGTIEVRDGSCVDRGWTENREDSGFVVWNFGGDDRFGADFGITMAAPRGTNLNLGSNGGARYSSDNGAGSGGPGGGSNFALEVGHFRHVGNQPGSTGSNGWNFNGTVTGNGSDDRRLVDNCEDGSDCQTWHTIEWRFRLSSNESAYDGVWQVWFDGVEQVPLALNGTGGAEPLPSGTGPNTMPTHMRSGFNHFSLFDNTAFINSRWEQADVEGGIYIDDVVIATERIGHAYNPEGYVNETSYETREDCP